MFGWWRGNAYRRVVLDTVSLLMVDKDGTLCQALIKEYPGIENAIRKGEKIKQNRYELGIIITQSVLASTIAQMKDFERRRHIADSLCSWVDGGGVETFNKDLAEGNFNGVDGFDLRLRAALSFISNMQTDKRVEDDMCHRFLKEIVGALDGLDANERERQRYLDVFENIKETLRVGENDNSGVISTDYHRPVREEFCGVEHDVRIVSTPSGLVIQRKDDESPVTERRTVTQDQLREVPRDAENLKFVNLRARSGEIYSCIIVEPEGLVIGNQRAAWWSLAKAIVQVTEAKANGFRMTAMAHAHVHAVARAVWDAAVKETPIKDMRDQIMPMRQIHFGVINKGMESAENDAQRLGREIALALVMAVQSEDERLEHFAYSSLKKFILIPGEEPEEFWQHEDA
jgi:hypothetical protein